jgi:hypothetical protein
MRHARRNLDAAKVRAVEANSVIDWRGLEREGDFVPGMKADSGAVGHPTKRALIRHQDSVADQL